MLSPMTARTALPLLLVIAALATGAGAHAGGQAGPAEDEVVRRATPVFTVVLAADDLSPRVDVQTEDGRAVGSCVPAPTSCSLATPLANGVYLWSLHYQNRFCDGYQGEICSLVDRVAGPTRFEVAVPRVEPRTIVLGRSIGAAELGMSRARIGDLYGEPLRSAPAVETFAVEGGTLTVTYGGDRVRGLATTSARYRTATGLGVGAKAPSAWTKAGRELVRGSTRLLVAGGRVARVAIAVPAARR